MAILKRLASPKFMQVKKKEAKFVVTPKNGYDKIPLVVVLRDILEYAKTAKEAKKIVKGGHVLVDGVTKKDPRFGVGLMDVVSLDDKHYRVVPTKRGIELTKIPESEATVKLLRVNGKTVLGKGKIQVNFHDGNNLIVDNDVSTKDSVLVKIPEKKIDKNIEYKEGSLAVIIYGKNAGVVGKIKEIHKVEGLQKNKVLLEVSGNVFELPENYVFTVGEDTPLITVTKSD